MKITYSYFVHFRILFNEQVECVCLWLEAEMWVKCHHRYSEVKCRHMFHSVYPGSATRRIQHSQRQWNSPGATVNYRRLSPRCRPSGVLSPTAVLSIKWLMTRISSLPGWWATLLVELYICVWLMGRWWCSVSCIIGNAITQGRLWTIDVYPLGTVIARALALSQKVIFTAP